MPTQKAAPGRIITEPAFRLSGFARAQSYWLRPFSILLALFLFGDLSAAAGRGLLPVYSEEILGREPDFASLLISARLLFSGGAAFLGGALSDSLGQRRVLLLGLSGLGVVSLVFLTGSPWALMVYSIYAGFTGGAYYLGGDTYTLATVPKQHLGVAAALIFTAPTLGGALGNSLSGLILSRYDFATLGVLGAVMGTAVFVGGLVFMPKAPPQVGSLSSAQSLSGYGAIIKRPEVLLLGALRFIPTAYWGTATLLFPLLIYRVSGSPSSAAYYGTAMLLHASACQLISGRLSDRVERTRLVMALTALIAASSLAASTVTGSLVGLYLTGVLGAGFAWALSVPIPGLISQVAPPGEQGRTLGFTHICWYTGMVAGTQLGGWLVQVDSALPFIVVGVFNLAAVACAVLLHRRVRARAAAGSHE